MKVFFVHNRYMGDRPSGENAVVELDIELLRASGVEVVAYLPCSDEIRTMPLVQKMSLPVQPTYSRRAARDVRAIIEREAPDVVHLHNPYPLISPYVVRLASSAGVQTVMTVHNHRMACAAGTAYRDGHECNDCMSRRLVWPSVAHRCYRGSRTQSIALMTAITMHRSTWRHVTRFVAPSAYVANFLASQGVDRRRISVRPHPVPDQGVAEGPGNGFLYLGRLEPSKGVGLLVDAWKQTAVGELGTLTLAGAGELESQVAALAAARPDVRFLGVVSPATASQLIAEAAVVTVPSHGPETFGLTAAEALSHGRPVVTTGVGGLSDVVSADTAWLCQPTTESLLAALRRAYKEMSPAHRVAARARYERLFAPGMATESLLRIYGSIR